MEKNKLIKNSIPHFIAVLIFLIVGFIYFSPALEGKKLNQTDIIQGKGAQQEIQAYNETHDDVALWTNSMFAGMPTYQIATKFFSQKLVHIRKAIELWTPVPIAYFMLYTLGFYILLIVLGVNPWLSIAGAFAFAFSSYNFIIIEAGHIWKVRTIAFMAPTFAGIYLIYKDKYLKGLILTSLFLTLQVFSNHLQMTYYFMLFVSIFIAYQLIVTIGKKEYKKFIVATAFFAVAGIISFGINADRLWTTYEYSKFTIRGESELTLNKDDKSKGLDRSYITGWSYGQQETFSLMIPNAKGGASDYIGNNKKAIKKVDTRYRQQIARESHYWGNQPGTSGPVYVGAIIMFLFVLGLFVVKDKIKWVLLIATIFSIMLSWGKNFLPLTDFFIDYFPMYNKFRAVSSILVVASLCIPVLAFLAINEVMKKPEVLKTKMKSLYWAFGLTGGLALVFYLLPSTFFDFLTERESQAYNQFMQSNPQQSAGIQDYLTVLEQTRMSIFKADALRSLIFIILAAAAIWMYTKKIVKQNVLIIGIGVLVLIDMYAVDKRYLKNTDFVSPSKVKSTFSKSVADEYILNDKSLNYRVVNIAMNPFAETFTSYYHKALGGYHGAKLKRYQELIEYQLTKDLQAVQTVFNNKPSDSSINATLQNAQILNMLNTKYFIYSTKAPALENKFANGNAWFANQFKIVENANDEILSLDKVDLKNTLVIDKRYKDRIPSIKTDSLSSVDGSSIKLISYSPNKLEYEANAVNDKIAVFSEIYYPAGWNAYIDGQETDYFRGNYLLRCMKVPKGKHTITFEFHPKSYYLGNKIAKSSAGIFMLILLYFLFVQYKKNKKVEATVDKKQ